MDDEVRHRIEGEYTGTFLRNGNSSNVELTLKDQEFSGVSETVKFPAICKGEYRISGNTITFVNECPWTAEFDWTLILSDTWNYNFVNNTLTLQNAIGDKYILTKK